jgi:hypothetical protein
MRDENVWGWKGEERERSLEMRGMWRQRRHGGERNESGK